MRRVLVTGASAGIGEASVRALIAAGFEVYAGVRQKRDGVRLRSELGPAVTPLILDVTRRSTVARALAAVKKRGGLYGLVNNAGVSFAAPVECTSLPALRELFEVNVHGVVAVTQAFLPLLRAEPGRVVNVSSLSAMVTAPFLGAYCASKAALESLTDALRMEVLPWRVEVALICPGPTVSKIWKRSESATRRLWKASPPEVRALYAVGWQRFNEVLTGAEADAGPVAKAAHAVVDALTAAVPQTRYVLDEGRSAQVRGTADRDRDQLLLRSFGLPGV